MTNNQGHYPLRNIPGDLWRRAKVKSAETDIPIRRMLIEGLQLWLDSQELLVKQVRQLLHSEDLNREAGMPEVVEPPEEVGKGKG